MLSIILLVFVFLLLFLNILGWYAYARADRALIAAVCEGAAAITELQEAMATEVAKGLKACGKALEERNVLAKRLQAAEAARVAQRNNILDILGLQRHPGDWKSGPIPEHRPTGDEECAGLGQTLLDSIPDGV